MRKRNELTNPDSCLNRARVNEMTFVLLGRDAAAPATIQFWIAERIRLGKNTATDPEIVEAQACATMMAGERVILRQFIRRDELVRKKNSLLAEPLTESEKAELNWLDAMLGQARPIVRKMEETANLSGLDAMLGQAREIVRKMEETAEDTDED